MFVQQGIVTKIVMICSVRKQNSGRLTKSSSFSGRIFDGSTPTTKMATKYDKKFLLVNGRMRSLSLKLMIQT